MLVSVNINDIKNNNTEIQGVYNGKRITPSVEVVCNKDTVSKTLKTLLPIFKERKTKVIHVSYEGDLSYLEEVLFSADYSAIPIVLKRNLSEVGQVDLMITSLPKHVKLAIKIDMEIPNIMKVVHGYSQKYENISFCGDNLIALKGCRLGCTNKVTKDLVALDGCYSGYKEINLDDIEELEFVEATLKPTPKVKVKNTGVDDKECKQIKEKQPKEFKPKEPKPKKDKPVKTVKSKAKKSIPSILARRLGQGE